MQMDLMGVLKKGENVFPLPGLQSYWASELKHACRGCVHQRLENKMSLRANTFFANDFFNQLILSEMSILNSPKADSQKTDAMVSHSDKLFLI